MIAVLATLALFMPIPRAVMPGPPVRQQSQELVLKELEKAVKGEDSKKLVRALSASARVTDLRVTQASMVAITDSNRGVRAAALDTLRFNKHPKALEALHTLLEKPAGLRVQPEIFALLIQATASHGSIESLPLITKGGFIDDPAPVLRARILGMGKIHEKASVEALMIAMQDLPAGQRLLHMDEFRLALAQLTGVDHGLNSRSWVQWWLKTGPGVALRDQEMPLPGPLKSEWDDFWETPTEIPLDPPGTKTPQPVAKKKKKPNQKQVKEASGPGKGKQKGPGAQQGKQGAKGKNQQAQKGKGKGKQNAKAKQNANSKQDGKANPNAKAKQNGNAKQNATAKNGTGEPAPNSEQTESAEAKKGTPAETVEPEASKGTQKPAPKGEQPKGKVGEIGSKPNAKGDTPKQNPPGEKLETNGKVGEIGSKGKAGKSKPKNP
ncbi:MAG: hypothetical protein ACI9F9_002574 [Candidatus Paceibacteria bacterium]|jgi:hypothetical protein